MSAKLSMQEFDLLVCDLAITRGVATAFLEKILGPFSGIKVGWTILLSNQAKPSNLGNFKKNTFISKPLDEAYFLEIVQTVCGGSSGKNKNSIDVAFINPFIDATLKVLTTTANTEAKKCSVCLRKRGEISGDISSLIAMNSERYLGSMGISFEENCFLGVVGNMLGEKYQTITPDIQDAVGELCNQIFGQSKMVLNQMGHTIQAAIPSVIVGKGHHIKHLIDGVCIAVHFETSYGKFVVETVLRERGEGEN